MALARRPRDLPRYLTHNGFRKRAPLELGLPWMPYSVIDFLDRWITTETVVYECGSGGSTVFFARRAERVVTIESEADWARLVENRLADERLFNVEVRHASADFSRPETLFESEFYGALPEDQADLVVVDSMDHQTHRTRPILFRRAEESIRPGGLIVLDDAWRYRQLRDESRAKRVRTFRGVGPGTRRPQWTDVFYY